MGSSDKVKGIRFSPIRVEGATEFSFEPPMFFPEREEVARSNSYPEEDQFKTGLDLAYRLFAARVAPSSDQVHITLTYLCIKSLNDLLAAVVVIKNGYHFQSWPLLRGGLEAAELMDYFRLNPTEIQGWLDKEKRFNSLSWIRNRLPNTELRQQLFDLLNETAHANLRNIDAMSSWNSGPGVRTLAVGPLPFTTKEQISLKFASFFISYPIRVLWLSNQDVVSSDWVSEFNLFDSESGFLLREDTTAKSVDDLNIEQPDVPDIKIGPSVGVSKYSHTPFRSPPLPILIARERNNVSCPIRRANE